MLFRSCRHGWHYRFKWHGHDYRDSLDTVLGRHVDSKTEALREVENIYDSVREGRFGIKPAAPLTLRQVGEIYFQKYLSPKTGRALGRNEHYRWKLVIDTLVGGRPLGDYVATEIRKHHVDAFLDANRVDRVVTVTDSKGNTYQAKRGGVVSTNRCLGRLKAFFNWDDQGTADAVPAAIAGVQRRCVRVRQRGRRAPEKLSEGMVDASASRARPRAALGTEREVPALLPRATGENEPPHARPTARSRQSATGARR